MRPQRAELDQIQKKTWQRPKHHCAEFLARLSAQNAMMRHKDHTRKRKSATDDKRKMSRIQRIHNGVEARPDEEFAHVPDIENEPAQNAVINEHPPQGDQSEDSCRNSIKYRELFHTSQRHHDATTD
jgi:hypothetical protein